MTSSIRRIDLKEALQSYHQTTDSPTLLSGWDETIADDDDFSPSDADAEEALHQRSHIRGTSITPHAMAHKSWVFGITEKDEDGSDEDNRRYYTNYHDNNNKKPTQDWKIRWKTSLAPHRINQVASNPSGTVIAATTDNGAVSIIRGSDGRVLATRRVVVKEQQDSAALEMAPEASFITTHQRCSSNSQNSTIVGDALLVQTPDQPTLLVSNIQGDRLNDNNDSVVTRATKSMNLQMVKIPSIQSFDIQCLRGYFYYSKKKPPFLNDDDDEDINYDTKIRLTLIHNDLTGEARLALAEYDLGSQSCQLIQKNISLGSSWEIDTITGLRLISFADRFVLALAAHSIGQSRHQQQFNSKIIWIDPDHDLDTHKVLSDTGVVMVKGEYPLVSVLQENGIIQEHTNKYQRCRIQALEFTHACNSQEAIAMVVAIEGEKKSSNVQILQTQVILEDESQDETCSTLQLGRAHLVYRLLIPSTVGTVQSICLCPLDKEIYGPYSFRSMTSLGWNRHEEIHAFQTRKRSGDNLDIVDRHDGSAIGAIRLLITKQEFNKARALVHDVGMEILLQDEYAQFHPAEIVLEKLRQSLVSSSSSSSSSSPLDRSIPNENWYESLTGLKRGTGNEKGQRVVLEAADYLLNWHPNTEIKDASSLDFQISLKQLASYLSSFVETMKNVSNDFLDQDVPSWISVPYQNRVHALEERMIAIQYLNDLLNNINSDDDAVVCLESEVSTNSMLSPQYSSIGSIDDLFSCFVQNGNFVAAEEMWGSTMRSKLTVETMVSSILRIPSTIAPRKYATLLDEIVLPSLSINHELVPSILSWSCQMADEFDDVHEDGLDRSIYLLETIERATKILRLNVHSSFAYYSPFVDQANSGNSKGRLFSFKDRTTNVSKSGILSLDSSFGSEGRSLVSHHSDDSISFDKRVKNDSSTKNNNQRPNPTILELGRMKRGAARLGQIPSLGVEAIDENEGNVGLKLETARWLKLARSLGLGRRLVSLCNFVDQGGAEFVSKELIRYFSSSAISHEERYDGLTIDVKKFCNESRAGYDKALMAYTKELCGGKNTSPQAIEEVASIARCCLSPTSKCQVTKIALQAALFCRFSASWLGLLSKDAIEWSSGDSSLRSELEEASRLLLIDCIVGRYCGNGAKELFHVDNPLHAANLLNFVSKHLDHDSVLSDILDLCEAFHHLSVEDGCGRLIQNTVLKGNQIKAKGFLLDLYDRNIASAHNVFSRVISFCIDLIEDNTSCIRNFSDVKSDFQSSMREEESKIVTLCAYDLTKIALVHSGMIVPGRIGSGFSTSHYNELKLQSLLHDLEQLKILQQDHNIFVSLADLNNPKVLVEISSKLLNGLAGLYIKGEFNAASSIATQTRRACSLLSRPPMLTESDLLFTSATPVACQLALKTNGLEALDFLSDLRILEASQSNFASRCCLAVALSYCMKLSKKSEPCLLDKMKGLVMASSLLEDYILSHCPPQILGISVDLSQLCGIVSQVLARADEGVGEKLDVFRKVLLERAAEKRWSFALHKNDIGESLRISQPTLHPSWYVGDGLLLPPEEALRKGIDYCKQSMGLQLMDDPSMGIHAFVASRGAHALALRILSHSTMVQICLPQSDCSLEELVDFNQQIGIELVERYLGGVGNGITSGVVDSQLAAAFLLSLPLKLAFKIYRSSLPTAISTRDFSRVVTLATVGKVCSSKDSIMSPTGARVGNWTSQNKFVSQCDSIATEATWWCVLEENDVNFNPHNFDYKEKNNLEDSYTASMIPALIFNMMSGKDGEIDSTLELVVKFANAFSLPNDIPACRFIQYLLSPIESDHDQYARQKISCLDDTVRKLLRLLDCSSKRINILRKCLIQFEGQDNCVDYERLCVLYATYQTEINIVLTKNSTDKNEPCMEKFYVEMEVIDRRRDALAILSSYFQGDKTNERPSFSQFFAPLNKSIDDNTNMEISSKLPSSRILGWEMTPKVDTFDPLNGLEKILRASCSSAVTSALSPICLPLGVPRGYIRVRSLITRFQKSNAEGASLPAFEDDVLPTLSQLRAPSDVAEVAEWCSKQYGLDTSENKLKCLDYALNYAIKASMEFERSVGEGKEDQNKGKNDDDELLALTLTRVKRITSARDLLADRLEITKILTLETKIRGLSKVLKRLNNKLEREVWSKSESFVPERFVDTLFTEASLLVAEATLCENESLSVGQFRQLSHLIHRVCNLISGKYSHVQTGYLARRLTRRWLFHGDMQASETDKEKNDNMIPVISQHNNLIPDIQEEEDTEEDTVNFQMDLSILKGDKGWATDFSTGAINSTKEKKKLTSEEEPTSLQATSEREISELASHRSSLRIAFVIAFADGYHRSLYNDSNDGNNEENNENSETVLNLKTNMSKMPREGLLSKMKKTRMNEHSDQHTSVLEHARELVRIVFAKSTSTDLVMKGLNESFNSISVSGSNRSNPATLTFAMRHRCLRVASILVPQEALEEVLNEDNFASNSSLKACSFGSFCAKELEETGLPIPHSDLLQLSQMHFPSYARALWRHHRDIKGAKGRLLLLILELYLKESISDNTFFLSIIEEIETLNLPRTLLNAFECIVRYMDKIGPTAAPSFLGTNIELHRITKKLLQHVYADLKRNIDTSDSDMDGDIVNEDRNGMMSTITRLGRIIAAFSNTSGGQRVLVGFSQELINIFPVLVSMPDECQGLRVILEHTICRVADSGSRLDLFGRLSELIDS